MRGVSVGDLLGTLDEAMTARVVTDVPDARERSRFAHVLIRDALYDSLTPARRVSLHRAAAGVLEDDAELAYHAMAGNDLEKALACAQRAGDRALGLLAYEEAARLYDVALAAKPDERTRCELMLGRGEAEMRAGQALDAKETFVAAAEVARRLGLDRELARAAAGYGGLIVWSRAGDDARLVPLLEEGLAALGDDEIELRVRLLARLAGALRDEPSRERRDALSREAVELARSAGDSAALAYALVGRAHAITSPDTITEFDELATELTEVAAAVGDRERVEAGHVLRVMARHLLGDMDGAAADLDAASRIADELRQPVHLWEVLGIRATLAVSEGRFDEADALIDSTLAAGEHALPESAVAHHRMQRAALCEFLGGLEAMEPLLAALVTEQPARPVFACALAHAHALLKRTSDAQLELAALTRNGVVRLPFDQEWLLGVALLAETCALISDVAAAAALYAALLPWEALNAVDQSEGCRGSAARHLGLLATVLARWNDAERHFERALAANERMGFRPWLARTQEDFARMLRVRGDVARAAALEATALATYEELGAAPA
jgi:tetratricopeptide (TPR) repeat protein